MWARAAVGCAGPFFCRSIPTLRSLALDRSSASSQPLLDESQRSCSMTVIMTMRGISCLAAFTHTPSDKKSDAGPEVWCSCQRLRSAGRGSQPLPFPPTLDSTIEPRENSKPEPACRGGATLRRQASRQSETPELRSYCASLSLTWSLHPVVPTKRHLGDILRIPRQHCWP